MLFHNLDILKDHSITTGTTTTTILQAQRAVDEDHHLKLQHLGSHWPPSFKNGLLKTVYY